MRPARPMKKLPRARVAPTQSGSAWSDPVAFNRINVEVASVLQVDRFVYRPCCISAIAFHRWREVEAAGGPAASVSPTACRQAARRLLLDLRHPVPRRPRPGRRGALRNLREHRALRRCHERQGGLARSAQVKEETPALGLAAGERARTQTVLRTVCAWRAHWALPDARSRARQSALTISRRAPHAAAPAVRPMPPAVRTRRSVSCDCMQSRMKPACCRPAAATACGGRSAASQPASCAADNFSMLSTRSVARKGCRPA
jgi:hypothetical protein